MDILQQADIQHAIDVEREKLQQKRRDILKEILTCTVMLDDHIDKFNDLFADVIGYPSLNGGNEIASDTPTSKKQKASAKKTPAAFVTPHYNRIAIETYYNDPEEPSGVEYVDDDEPIKSTIVTLVVSRMYYTKVNCRNSSFYDSPRVVEVRVSAKGGYVPERDARHVHQRAIDAYLTSEGLGYNSRMGEEGRLVHVKLTDGRVYTNYVAVVRFSDPQSPHNPEIQRLIRFNDASKLPDNLQFKVKNEE